MWKTKEENIYIRDYFYNRLPKFEISQLGFREKLWLYKAHLWYSFLTQDFLNCYKYASKWVELFYENPMMINSHPVFFLKGNNYLLESLFFIRRKDRFEKTLSSLEKIIKVMDFLQTIILKHLVFIYKSS